MKKTKIICTIGPVSLSKKMLKQMYHVGMNGARINTAYGTLDQYKLMIDNIREKADIPIIVDIKGPEIRIQATQKKTVKREDVLEVGFNHEPIRFNHNFYDKISIGDPIYIDNGQIKTHVIEKNNGTLRLLIMNDGEIADGKGVNIPNKKLAVPSLLKKDRKIIKFSNEYDVEYIALSFTRSVQDVSGVKGEGFKGDVIAKIENSEGEKY